MKTKDKWGQVIYPADNIMVDGGRFLCEVYGKRIHEVLQDGACTIRRKWPSSLLVCMAAFMGCIPSCVQVAGVRSL